MFSILVTLSLCLGSSVNSARCNAVRALEKAVERAAIVVAIVVKTIRPSQPVPPPVAALPPPTQTLPMWLPPTGTFPAGTYSPPLALWVVSFFLGGISIIILSLALAKTGIVQYASQNIRETFKTLIVRCKACLFVVVVSTPPFILANISKLYVELGTYPDFIILRLWLQGRRRAQLISGKIPGSALASSILLNAYGHILGVIAGLSTVAKTLGYGAAIQVARTGTGRQTDSTTSVREPDGLLWSSSRHWKPLPGFANTVDPATFKLGEDLGSGGYGDVVKVQVGAHKKPLAIKRVRKARDDVPEEQVYKALCSEVSVHVLMAGHPAFPVVHGIFEDAEYYYIAMDCGEECVLSVDISESAQVVFYAAQLVLALHELHRRGVLHADIKPDNLLLDVDRNLMIIDYGLATVFDMKTSAQQARTDDLPLLWPGPANPHSAVVRGGTEGYMSPAVHLGRCSFGADLFAVGVVIHYWLAQDMPTMSPDFEWIPHDPSPLSPVERDFLFRLFSIDRLYRFESYTELKGHPFWDGLSWQAMEDSWWL
ncbi:kinase-like domain-containing protein [Mycena latifolia]|nr:kinase-like domain-containing protein [Mycena latifolia]